MGYRFNTPTLVCAAGYQVPINAVAFPNERGVRVFNPATAMAGRFFYAAEWGFWDTVTGEQDDFYRAAKDTERGANAIPRGALEFLFEAP